MWIVLMGPPGAGKGTQAAAIARRLSVLHLSTGEMLRQARDDRTSLGLTAAKLIDEGKYVPDDLITRIVFDRINQPDCKDGCLFDGFPRTVAQAEKLDEYLDHRNAAVDLVLAICVEESNLVERLLGRGRTDDRPEVIRRRFREYETQTRPLFDFYQAKGVLREIDGNGTPDQVGQRVQSCLDEAGAA